MKLFMLTVLVSTMELTCAGFDLGTCSLQCDGQTVHDGPLIQNQLRGPSGKRGPAGPIGLSGPKGDPGAPCDCLNEGKIKTALLRGTALKF